MDVNNPFNEMMTAERLSNDAIIHGMQVGTIQPFVGYSILDKRTKEAKQRELVRAAMQQGAGGPPPTVGQQVMQAADQVTRPAVPPSPTPPATDRQRPAPSMGIEAARSNMPEQYAGGGIIAFNGEDGSVVPDNSAIEKLKAAGYDPETSSAGPGDVLGWMGRKAKDTVFLSDPNWKPKKSESEEEYYRTTQPSPSKAKKLAGAEGGDTPWYDRAADWWHENVVEPGRDLYFNTAMSGSRKTMTSQPPTPQPNLQVVRPQAQPAPAPSAGIRSIDMASGMAPAPAAVNQALSPDTSMQDALAESRKSRQDLRDMITGQSSGDADKLRQLQGMSMLQAGLGIASGGSPWFSRNLAGALPAVESYQKGLEQLDTAKQSRVKQLVDLGLKGEELDKALMQLGITKDYYDAHAPMFSAQARYYDAKAQEEGIKAALYPQVVQAKLARAAGAGGAGGLKAGMNLSEFKYADELKNRYMDDPRLGADHPGRNASVGSPSHNSYLQYKSRLAEDMANRDMNRYMQQKPKQARSGYTDFFGED